jgi:predicted transcriptional regulator
MVRTKITARIPPDLADSLRRIAVLKDRSISDVVEEAIIRAFADRSEAEHAALLVKLDSMARRLGVIEKSQETLFELTAHAARFAMSVAPEVPDADRVMLNARGSSRFQNVVAAIVARLSGGKSVWKDHFAEGTAAQPSVGVAAE